MTKITAKFSGSCKVCNLAWTKGQDIFYQKTPSAICSSEECYTSQGGLENQPYTKSSWSSGKVKTLEEKISDMIVLDNELYRLSMARLNLLESSLSQQIPIEQKLVFIESWARTIAMTMQR
jgi:hypothetical protein